MGDRALVIFCDKEQKDFSPVVYLHWNGQEVSEWLKESIERMRQGDVSYSAARFIGFCHGKIQGNTSLGTFNSPDTLDKIKDEDFSHGDSGVWLVNVDTGHVDCFNGYGKSFELGKLPN